MILSLLLAFSLQLAHAQHEISGIDYNSPPKDFQVPDEKDMVVALTQTPNQLQRLPAQFELLNWNIHKAEAGETWAKDFEMIAAGAEIVMIQEALTIPVVEATLQKITTAAFWLAQSFIFSDGVSTGVATGSTVIHESILGFRSPESEPIYKTPKTTLITIYPMEDGVPLMTINLHGLNFSGAEKLERQLEDLRPTVENFQGRKIFAGDFNTWNHSRQKVLLRFMKELNFTEVTFKDDVRKFPLDRVFLHGCHAENSLLMSEIRSSDHPPLLVQVACP